jgi:hypothetical protein
VRNRLARMLLGGNPGASSRGELALGLVHAFELACLDLSASEDLAAESMPRGEGALISARRRILRLKVRLEGGE